MKHTEYMKRFDRKKIILLALVLIAVFAVSGKNLVHAQLTPAEQRAALEAEFGDVQANANAGAGGAGGGTNAENLKPVTGITLAATTIAAKVLELVAGLITFAISLGNDILLLPVVIAGFQTMLMFANLGFVLAIIVMAFAIIFQFQSYGAKQLLARLIIAALLVNFTVVIAGAFISVSNTFTGFFLEPFQGNLGKALANALDPQKLGQVAGVQDNPSGWGLLAWGFERVLSFLASLVFVLIFTLLIVVTFLAIFVMLLIRDVYLAILIILMPLVWLLWIFPATRQYWKQWWSQFLRWVFFAPIMLFFIYIVVSTADKMSDLRAFKALNGADTTRAFAKGLTFGEGIVLYIAQLIIMVALLIGGMMVANKIGIAGASTVYGMAQGAGKSARGWVGKKGKQYGSSVFRTGFGESGKSVSERWAANAQKSTSFVGRKGWGLLAGGALKFSKVGGEDLVKQHEAQLKNMNPAQLKNALATTITTPKRIAILNKLKENGDLDEASLAQYKTRSGRSEFKRFGYGRQFSQVEKYSGSNVEMDELAKQIESQRKSFTDQARVDKTMVYASDPRRQQYDAGQAELKRKLNAETEKFAKTFSTQDMSKVQWNDVFSAEPKFGLPKEASEQIKEAIVTGFAKVSPGAFSKMFSQIKGNNFDRFIELADRQIKLLEASSNKEEREAGERARDSLKSNMVWRTVV